VSKTRNLSDLLDANGDVKTEALDNATLTGIDDNATSTAVTIDSSNNVLVGTTDNTLYSNSGAGNGGVMLAKTVDGGRIDIAREGVNLITNRLASDGLAIEVKKDGTTIGSISSNNGSIEIDSQGTSLKFSHLGTNRAFLTANNFAPYTDNAMDLAYSASRFKDLYLGGNIYLGGTGSANALDDYEEGTWTPTYSSETGSFGSITYDNSVQGFYTKIGRMVHLMGFLRTDAVTVGTASSYLYLDGLPFTILNGYTAVGINTRGGTSDWGGNYPLTLEGVPNASKAFIGYRSTANSNQTLIQVSDMVTGVNSNKNTLYFSITYQST
jgi:hypothetical protein